ncbi:endolytic transglycosylase MltG [Alteribacillus sp. HJP-4]|uniref:endolytic transglycosylase MltG n=1 Tax=Alteribacillus sp. HJP-4 TaxID=2775394 RepID=UPI0035CCD906
MKKKTIRKLAAGWFSATCCMALFYFASGPTGATESTQTSSVPESRLQSQETAITEEEMINELEKMNYTVTSNENGEDEESQSSENGKTIHSILHVEEGMTSSEVADSLQRLQIINDKDHFSEVLAGQKAETGIQAGYYELSSEMSGEEIVDTITSQ